MYYGLYLELVELIYQIQRPCPALGCVWCINVHPWPKEHLLELWCSFVNGIFRARWRWRCVPWARSTCCCHCHTHSSQWPWLVWHPLRRPHWQLCIHICLTAPWWCQGSPDILLLLQILFLKNRSLHDVFFFKSLNQSRLPHLSF